MGRYMENEDKSPEFGRYLRTHRRSKGISLEDVSQRTKITVASLRQLEDEDLEKLPAPPFVKGFIRAYAEVVGVDVQEAVRRYEEKLAPLAKKEQDLIPPLEMVGRRKWHPIALIGLSCVLLGVALFFLAQYRKAPEEPTPQQVIAAAETDLANGKADEPVPNEMAVEEHEDLIDQDAGPAEVDEISILEKEPPETAQNEPVRSKAPEPLNQNHVPDSRTMTTSPEETITAPVADVEEELVLEIAAVERTWIRIKIDEDQVKEVTIDPQDKMTVKAKEQFELFIGNAGGVQLKLNGQAIDVPGKSGQVAKMRLP